MIMSCLYLSYIGCDAICDRRRGGGGNLIIVILMLFVVAALLDLIPGNIRDEY